MEGEDCVQAYNTRMEAPSPVQSGSCIFCFLGMCSEVPLWVCNADEVGGWRCEDGKEKTKARGGP